MKGTVHSERDGRRYWEEVEESLRAVRDVLVRLIGDHVAQEVCAPELEYKIWIEEIGCKCFTFSSMFYVRKDMRESIWCTLFACTSMVYVSTPIMKRGHKGT